MIDETANALQRLNEELIKAAYQNGKSESSTILLATQVRDKKIAERLRHALGKPVEGAAKVLAPYALEWIYAAADDLEKEMSVQQAADLLHLGDKP